MHGSETLSTIGSALATMAKSPVGCRMQAGSARARWFEVR
jgi:hypothetical protein